MESEGKCKYCNTIFSGKAMSRHLQSCKERIKANQEDKEQGNVFLMRATAGPFFVYFEANSSDKLSDIDQFLRDLWLECCGHLSSFTINGVSYDSHPGSELDNPSMNKTLSSILKPGLKFIHEYDFGSTTQLDMKCISERQGKVKNINIIARNDLPDFKCDKCGKPAKEICTECAWGEGLLCESCAKEHECGEEMLLPVVNSPRMGMCGYTGKD